MDRKPVHDYPSKIFEFIKDQCKYFKQMSIDYESLRKKIMLKGYSEEELSDTLKHYMELNLIMQ